MQLTCETYEALSKEALYAILRLRSSVFIAEQGCLYQDIDNKDKIAYHCMLHHEEILAGYCRILPSGIKHTYPAITRYALHQNVRGKGWGKRLFAYAIERLRHYYPHSPIYIQAQHYLHDFYSAFDFVQLGEVYDEAGIAHIDMVTYSCI